jgi:hypothetical protein
MFSSRGDLYLRGTWPPRQDHTVDHLTTVLADSDSDAPRWWLKHAGPHQRATLTCRGNPTPVARYNPMSPHPNLGSQPQARRYLGSRHNANEHHGARPVGVTFASPASCAHSGGRQTVQRLRPDRHALETPVGIINPLLLTPTFRMSRPQGRHCSGALHSGPGPAASPRCQHAQSRRLASGDAPLHPGRCPVLSWFLRRRRGDRVLCARGWSLLSGWQSANGRVPLSSSTTACTTVTIKMYQCYTSPLEGQGCHGRATLTPDAESWRSAPASSRRDEPGNRAGDECQTTPRVERAMRGSTGAVPGRVHRPSSTFSASISWYPTDYM